MPINAGMMSSDRSDWETPRELFDRCDSIWHFDLDVASSDENALCERHFTKDNDALKQSWGGRRSWMNPPYGREIAAWVEKAARESEKPNTIVVGLLPARTDTTWWTRWVEPVAAEIQFLSGRVRFCIGGVQQQSAPFPSVLVRWGGELPKKARG